MVIGTGLGKGREVDDNRDMGQKSGAMTAQEFVEKWAAEGGFGRRGHGGEEN